MRTLFLTAIFAALSQLTAADREALTTCRNKADDTLRSELKACKQRPEADRKSCSMEALNRNSEAIKNCGSVRITQPPAAK